jgi:hypothetical protein
MGEITVTRTGRVLYLAGYEQTRFRLGSSPVYKTARVEQYSDGSVYYYPPTAATTTPDDACELPADLLEKVVWDN